MNLRWRLGAALERLAGWLMYPPLVVCQRPGCGYVEGEAGSGGVHQSADDCMSCELRPEKRGEHHPFEPPPWWRRIGARPR